MFVKAIEKASGYFRPIHVLYRYYNETELRKMAFNIIFVNEYGVAITAKHVAERIEQLTSAHDNYLSFLSEKGKLSGTTKSTKLKSLETKYGYRGKDIFPAVQASLKFFDCFTEPSPKFRFIHHSRHDLSIMLFENYGKRLCKSYARFVSDKTILKPGLSVCKLGYINPQFTNYEYDATKDEIKWTAYPERDPAFYPVEGIVTRNLINGYYVYALETSSPALPGLSGGPLINTKGTLCGINTHAASLDFTYNFKKGDPNDVRETVTLSYQPKFLVGQCLHADIIKLFLKAHKIKFYKE